MPCALSWSICAWTAAGLDTAADCTSIIRSPGTRRLPASLDATSGSTAVTTTPFAPGVIMNLLRKSSERLDNSNPNTFWTTRLLRRCRIVVAGIARRRRIVAGNGPANFHLERLLLALANNDNVYGLADRRRGDDARQVAHIFDVLTVEADDDVADLHATKLGRPAAVDTGDDGAVGRIDAEAVRNVGRNGLDAYAYPAANGRRLLDGTRGGLDRRWRRSLHGGADAGARTGGAVPARELAPVERS